MSRHRRVRNLDYDEEYDEYFNYGDDYDDYDDHLQPAKEAASASNASAPTKTKQAQQLQKNKLNKNSQTDPQKKNELSKQQANALTNSKSKQAPSKSSSTSSSTATVIKAVTNLSLKKPNTESTIKEYEEFVKSSKPRVNLIVVGHVDSGKSTLVGRFLYDIGSLNQKQMHKNEVESKRLGKASFKYAWVLDETNQERERGITIDLAFTKFETKRRVIVVVDSPGHVDFIPAVISGAAQADSAILVVDSTNGEFETGFEQGGQTKEHAFLVRSLGVKSLIVAVNKMDVVDWSYERFDEIKEKLEQFLVQAGFDLKDIQFIACSGLMGDNLTERWQNSLLSNKSSHPQLEATSADQWKGMLSLMEALDRLPTPTRLVDSAARVVVNDVYPGLTGGVSLGAKVCGGKVAEKQSLLLLPPNEVCVLKSVTSIEVSDVVNAKGRAFAGDIVTLVATGIEMLKYYRGCVLCDPFAPCHVTNRFQARIIMFQGTNAMLVRGSTVEVHMNGAYESGEVRRLISLISKTNGQLIKAKPKCVPRNSSALIQLRLNRPVCMELYRDNKDLGRFMMRSCGKTIAAGLVTKIKPSKMSRAIRLKAK